MIAYIIFRIFVLLFSVLPFSVIYCIADFISWLLYRVIRYRRKVVETQLKTSFPNLSDREIQDITKKSYVNLGDIIVESIKGFSMSEDVYKKRYRFLNAESANQHTANGQGVILAASHYNNWEWGAISIPLWFSYPALGFYKPLSNTYLEAYAKKSRGRFNFILVPIGQTSEYIEKFKDKAPTLIFVSDQSTWSKHAHWVNFLGQETACPHGIEKYSKMLHIPVYYLHFERVRRGYYEIRLELLTDGKEHLAEGEITKRFMHTLEKDLQAKPENWLWSHKRWKRTRKPEEKLL